MGKFFIRANERPQSGQSSFRAQNNQSHVQLQPHQDAVVIGVTNSTAPGNFEVHIQFGTVQQYNSFYDIEDDQETDGFNTPRGGVSITDPIFDKGTIVVIDLQDDPEGNKNPDPSASKVNISIDNERTGEKTLKKEDIERSVIESMGLPLKRADLSGTVLRRDLAQFLLNAVQ
jgi:hypothetical protein